MDTRKASELEIIQEIQKDSYMMIQTTEGVKRVPADKVGKVKTVNGTEPDENGNIEVGGKFVVTITPNEEENGYVADKTFEEIKKAYNAGKVVVAIYYGMLEDINAKRMQELQIHNINNSTISFNVAQSGSNLQIAILFNDYVQISESKYVSKPTVGKVGQFLAVNSVNSSSAEGEPMSFECVDPPQGFGGEWDDIQNKPFYEYEQIKKFMLFDSYGLLNGVQEIELDFNLDSDCEKINIDIYEDAEGEPLESYELNVNTYGDYDYGSDIREQMNFGNKGLYQLYDTPYKGIGAFTYEDTKEPILLYRYNNKWYFVYKPQYSPNYAEYPNSALGGMSIAVALSNLSVTETVYKTISENYIPNNIPKIQSATVGQTIVVKEVDENGKPTEWEAVDVSSGSGDLPIYKLSNFTTEKEEEFNTAGMIIKSLRVLLNPSILPYGYYFLLNDLYPHPLKNEYDSVVFEVVDNDGNVVKTENIDGELTENINTHNIFIRGLINVFKFDDGSRIDINMSNMDTLFVVHIENDEMVSITFTYTTERIYV